MEFVVAIVLLGVATGWVAQSKGRNFFGWLVLGAVLPLLGLILALTVPRLEENLDKRALSTGDHKRCQYCAELIRTEALVCRFCGRDVSTTSVIKVQRSDGDVQVLAKMDADTLASLRATDLQNRH